MDVVHFTDAKELAVRGPIERGRRYWSCHDGREDSYYLSGQASALQMVMASNLQLIDDRDLDRKTAIFYIYSSRFGKKIERHYAADFGLWYVPGVNYHNDSNYLLDVNALLAQGIVIDTTFIQRLPDLASYDDDYSYTYY